jgi:hypothetical protein
MTPFVLAKQGTKTSPKKRKKNEVREKCKQNNRLKNQD